MSLHWTVLFHQWNKFSLLGIHQIYILPMIWRRNNPKETIVSVAFIKSQCLPVYVAIHESANYTFVVFSFLSVKRK